MNSPEWIFLETVISLHEESLSMFKGATAYAFGLAKNHPFFDGNKRIAFPTGVTFREVNGHVFTGSEIEAVLRPLALAASELDESGFAAWLAANSTPES